MTRYDDSQYFSWLVAQIEVRRNHNRTYNDLFLRMHETEFVWTVKGDDNRAQDALDLRTEFMGEHPKFKRRRFKEMVSVLELVIALSRRISFIAGGEASYWAWQLIENLGLNETPDPLTGNKAERVEEILESLIWRTYQRDGQGGFFPLNWSEEDQTKVELWYQMNAYVNEIQEP